MDKSDTNNKGKNIFSLILCFAVLITIIVGISYAFLNITKSSQANSITTGSISMSYTESTNGINLKDALPIKDDIGMNMITDGEFFDFNVTSTSSANINVPYEINISEKNIIGSISKKNIKIYLTKIVNGVEEEVIPPTTLDNFEKSNYRNDAIKIYFKENNYNNTDNVTDYYRLRMWISYETDANLVNDSSYSIAVNVDASAVIK